jgi:hypothetical protein
MEAHEHEWHLAVVDFEDALTVREFLCTCGEVQIHE